MDIIHSLRDILNSGDPILRSWTLVNSYYQPFLLSALYVLFVKRVGPNLMRGRKPFHLRKLMIVYNFSVVLTYLSCLLVLTYYFLTTDSYKQICSPTVVYLHHYSYTVTRAGYYIYILKYIEFADTVFFVLRKKFHLITNLHVIHHAVLPPIAWIFFRTETSGFQFIPGVINTLVHILMYFYYGVAAMGPKYQKYIWWKEHLTKIQMMQFVIIMFFVTILIPISGCKTSQHGIYIDFVFAVLFLALFYNFYIKTYKKKPLSKNNCNGNSHNNNQHQATEHVKHH